MPKRIGPRSTASLYADGKLLVRCDAACRNAAKPRCDCLCGGRMHGRPSTDAIREHTDAALDAIAAFIHPSGLAHVADRLQKKHNPNRNIHSLAFTLYLPNVTIGQLLLYIVRRDKAHHHALRPRASDDRNSPWSHLQTDLQRSRKAQPPSGKQPTDEWSRFMTKRPKPSDRS